MAASEAGKGHVLWHGIRGGRAGIRSQWRGTRAPGMQMRSRGNAHGRTNVRELDTGKTQPMGALLITIPLVKVQASVLPGDVTPRIEDCDYVASYSWLNRKTPTILVPGKYTSRISNGILAVLTA